MTTTQTIDGVLVSRELLEVFAGPRNYTPTQMRMAMYELRALLDAPAVQWLAMEVNGKPWVIKEGPNADKWRSMGYELFPVEPAPQHRGEPVAWVVFDNGFIDDHTVVKTVADEWADCGIEVTPLYAEQPAPVAVVMPDRKDPGEYRDASYTQTCMSGEWNACLDEVTRLTATVRIPERLNHSDGLHTYEYVKGHNDCIDTALGKV